MLVLSLRLRIEGKVALITGASRGIGAACAHEFARRGARLALTGRSSEKLSTIARSGDLAIAGDLMDESFRASLVDQTVSRFGRLDILINNAGVGLYAPVLTSPMPLVRNMFELNFFATLDLSQRAASAMAAQGAGAIVNVSSIAGALPLPWFPLYSASKSAVWVMTELLRQESAPKGIGVTLVAPGYVHTEFQENVLLGSPPESLRRAKRFAVAAADVARAVAEGVERNSANIVLPSSGRLLLMLYRLFPSLVASQLSRMNRELEQSA